MTTAPKPASLPPICSFVIAWSGNDPALRNIAGGGPDYWRRYIDTWILPSMDLGYCERIELHNPGGALAGEAMQLDQFIHAKAAGLDWVWRDFVKCWRAVDRHPLTGAPVEKIAYLGTTEHDPDWSRRRARPFDLDNVLKRLWESLQYPLDAGFSIAFDNMFLFPEGSFEWHAFGMIEALLKGTGRRAYIEPPAHLSAPHWWPKNGIITEQLYLNRIEEPRQNAWHPAQAKLRALGGEYIRMQTCPPPRYWITDPATGKVRWDWDRKRFWTPDWIRECQALGQTPMFGCADFVRPDPGKPRLTFAELMRLTDVPAVAAAASDPAVFYDAGEKRRDEGGR